MADRRGGATAGRTDSAAPGGHARKHINLLSWNAAELSTTMMYTGAWPPPLYCIFQHKPHFGEPSSIESHCTPGETSLNPLRVHNGNIALPGGGK